MASPNTDIPASIGSVVEALNNVERSNPDKTRHCKCTNNPTELLLLPEQTSTAPPTYPGSALPNLSDLERVSALEGLPIKKVRPEKSSSSLNTNGRSHKSRNSTTATKLDHEEPPPTPSDTSRRIRLSRDLSGWSERFGNCHCCRYDPSLSISGGPSEESFNPTSNRTLNTNTAMHWPVTPPFQKFGEVPDMSTNVDRKKPDRTPSRPARRETQNTDENSNVISRSDLESAAAVARLEEWKNKPEPSLYERFQKRGFTRRMIIVVSVVLAMVALIGSAAMVVHADNRVEMRIWYLCGVLVIFFCTGAGMSAGGQELIRISMVMTMELVLGFFLTGNVDVFKGMTS